MAVYKRGTVWWYSFLFAGRRIQESAKTTRKTLAVEAEKQRRKDLERAYAGLPSESREQRIRRVADVLDAYQENYGLTHRARSAAWVAECCGHLRKRLASTLLSDVTEQTIHDYIRARRKEGLSGRTINMDLDTLSRAMGKPWGTLWPNVKRLEERRDIGRALSADEEARLLAALQGSQSVLIQPFVKVALGTAMRCGEILALTWGQVDLEHRVITVGRAKTSSGTGRQIPIAQDLHAVLTQHAAWFQLRFGAPSESDHLFPFGAPMPSDPTRAATTIQKAWYGVLKAAGVQCRLHDLRHTAATKMAEAGVPESTMLSLMGHMSRAMLERYSHVRISAKRDAVEALNLRNRKPSLQFSLQSASGSGFTEMESIDFNGAGDRDRTGDVQLGKMGRVVFSMT